jgi:hypothetical protein
MSRDSHRKPDHFGPRNLQLSIPQMIPSLRTIIHTTTGIPNWKIFPLRRNFQLQEQEVGIYTCQKLFPLSKLFSTQATQSEPAWENELQICLSIAAWFQVSPNPPSVLGTHIFSQDTLALTLVSVPFQRNLLMCVFLMVKTLQSSLILKRTCFSF